MSKFEHPISKLASDTRVYEHMLTLIMREVRNLRNSATSISPYQIICLQRIEAIIANEPLPGIEPSGTLATRRMKERAFSCVKDTAFESFKPSSL